MSKVTSIPQLRFPEFSGEWKEKKLSDVAEIVGGGTPPTAVEKYWGGDIQWFTPTEIKNKYIVNSKRTITQVGLDTSSARLLPKGTLLFSSRATVGEIGIAVQECTTNQGFQSFIVNKDNDSEFLYNWIIKNKKEFIRRASGSTFLEIGKSEIKKIKSNIPLLSEQQKIAEFLTAVDNKIEQLSKKQELLSEYKKGLMQKIFSQAIRFKADDGSDFSDWEQVKLATLSKLVTKQTGYDYSSTIKPSLETSKDDSNIPFVQNKDFNSTSINLNTDFYVPVSVQKKYPRITLDEKCLLITISGNIGNVGVYNKQEKAFIGGAVCVAKFKDKDNIDFVKYYLTTDIGQKMMLREVKASSHQNITVEGIRNFRIMLPYLEEQKKIVVFLSIIDNKIEQAGKQLIESKQFKKALLQQMFV